MEATATEAKSGVVKWFNPNKGYGFIENADGSGDLFVHYSEIKMSGYKTLPKGAQVRFTVNTTEKGLCACNVQHVDSFGIAKE